jgi:hypothetical protein
MFCVAGLLAAPAIADTSQPAAPSTMAQAAVTPATQESAADLDTIVCKTMDPTTGSRLGARRVCQSQRAWNQLHEDAQKNLEGMQQRGLPRFSGLFALTRTFSLDSAACSLYLSFHDQGYAFDAR